MSWFKKLFTRKLHADIARLREQRDQARQQREQWRVQAEELAKERESLLASLQSASAKPATPTVAPADATPVAPDGLFTLHGADFRNDPAFQKAYAAGVAAAGTDYNWHWRVYVGLWAASYATRFDGDFVECGVYRGCLSAAIMTYLGWEKLPRQFYLLDTFQGLVETMISDEESRIGRKAGAEGSYSECFDVVKANFAKYSNVSIVRGPVPDTLGAIKSERIAYLSIDMNCAAPEIAAGEHLWPKLVDGGVILLDDYNYKGYEPQRKAWNAFAARHDVPILSLPTGQGLIVKSGTGDRPLFQMPMELAKAPVCPVCGASEFSSQKVLWEELITDWELRPEEVDYIDLQQGFSCKRCNTVLRCMTLASAMMAARGFRGTFTEFCDPAGPACGLDVLEINNAGNLTTYLSRLPRHKLASYPKIDMQLMPFAEAAFDIVVHSDTLEHVPDTRRALAECLRVLRPGGILVYTIPLVVGRTTRKRAGLKDSYHGRPGESDYRVETEYGADFWCELMEVGFGEVKVHTLLYPASVAIVAAKTGQWSAVG